MGGEGTLGPAIEGVISASEFDADEVKEFDADEVKEFEVEDDGLGVSTGTM